MRQVDRSAAARATLPIMLTMPTKVGTGRPMRQTSLTTPATLTIYPVSPVMVVAAVDGRHHRCRNTLTQLRTARPAYCVTKRQIEHP